MKKDEKKKQVFLSGDGFGILSNIVYSTGEIQIKNNNEDEEIINPEQQNLRIWFEKNGRGGKMATVIKGFEGNEKQLGELGRTLRKQISTGGSEKDGEIILQGNVGQKLFELLIKMGYKKTKKAGGF